MYARKVGERVYSFEPSGGLIHGALVMNDFETGSYWYLMTHQALAGPAKGTRLTELPVGQKLRFKDWVARHPETLVLSVNGVEDIPVDGYQKYFASAEGYRGLKATDERLPTKEPVFALTLEGRDVCVPLAEVEGGASVRVGEERLFLYRPRGAELFHSTVAFRGKVVRRGEVFVHPASGAAFDPSRERWEGGDGPQRLHGFDTFWVAWSLAHPKTEVVRPPRRF